MAGDHRLWLFGAPSARELPRFGRANHAGAPISSPLAAQRPSAPEKPCLRHGEWVDTSCMKALRCVKSCLEIFLLFPAKFNSVGVHPARVPESEVVFEGSPGIHGEFVFLVSYL